MENLSTISTNPIPKYSFRCVIFLFFSIFLDTSSKNPNNLQLSNMKRITKSYLLSFLLISIYSLASYAQTHVSIPYYQGFESSTNIASYAEFAVSGTNEYRIAIIDSTEAFEGNNHILMDDYDDGNNTSIGYLDLHVNLSGETSAELSFSSKIYKRKTMQMMPFGSPTIAARHGQRYTPLPQMNCQIVHTNILLLISILFALQRINNE